MEKENDREAEKNEGRQQGQAYLLPCRSEAARRSDKRSNADRMSILLMLLETRAKWKQLRRPVTLTFKATPPAFKAGDISVISTCGIATFVCHVRQISLQRLCVKFAEVQRRDKRQGLKCHKRFQRGLEGVGVENANLSKARRNDNSRL